MKTYVMANGKRFENIETAVAAFNDDKDIEQFDIGVYNAKTDEMLEYQTAKRNPYSGDFEYIRWYIGYYKQDNLFHDNAIEILDFDCDCEETARAKAIEYLSKHKSVYICTYSQTLYENIGDESCERIFLNKDFAKELEEDYEDE